MQDRAQPGFLAITTQQAHGTDEVLATRQGLLEANMEFVGLDVGRYELLQRAPNKIIRLVEHLVEEVGVDRLNPCIGIKSEDKHFAFQAFLDLLEAGKLLAKVRQFLLQAFVEHGKAPMAG
ncbi:hypothetical protein D3C73_1019280 [compost metagenome]